MELTQATINKYDPTNMYQRIFDFPQQLREGYNLPINGDLSGYAADQFKNVAIAGMGGSAIGGDFVRTYLADQLTVPLFINRNYGLPMWVDSSTLMIVSSYSGNTEETIAAFNEAKKRGCKIVMATTGGKIGQAAIDGNYPHVILPGGFEPRAALGYSFGPILNLMQKMGFIANQDQVVEDTCKFLEDNRKRMAVSVGEARNEAKKIANVLKDKIAIVYGGADFYDVAAIRFKGQICENGKHLSYANISPEFNHNELVGFDYPKALIKKLMVIFLSGPADSKGVTSRFKVVDKIVREKGTKSMMIKAKGPNRLAEIFSLVQLGDMASYYLALVNKTDPSPVHVINRLKASLEKMN